ASITALQIYHQCATRSACPSDRPGATQSRTRCFSSLASGKRPCAARDQMVSPSTRTSKTPPLPGCSATSPRSAANVVNNSSAIHAARNSHRHCVQYSISTRGCFGIPVTLYVRMVALKRPLPEGEGTSLRLYQHLPLLHRRPDDPAASS